MLDDIYEELAVEAEDRGGLTVNAADISEHVDRDCDRCDGVGIVMSLAQPDTSEPRPCGCTGFETLVSENRKGEGE